MGIDFGKVVMSNPIIGGAATAVTGEVQDSYARDAMEGVLGDERVKDPGEQTFLSGLNPFSA